MMRRTFRLIEGSPVSLYGGGPELRLKQEFLLGIGGWRLLEALGLKPEVCHLNEGHAAFAVLERARTFMKESGQPFDVALAVTRAGNLFTTHTAVEAGFDRFSPALIEQYLGRYAKEKLGISFQDLLALGRQNPEMIHQKILTWPIWHSAEVVQSMVSAVCMEKSVSIFLLLFFQAGRWTKFQLDM